MLKTELLDQFNKFSSWALRCSGTKLSKSIRNNIIEIILLFMVIPRKINFLQLGRYGTRGEQCYRQTFERKVEWMEFNLWLSAYCFDRQPSRPRMAIAFDPSFVTKAGKHTPHVGRYWSGCAGATKHGLEILGIGAVNVDTNECMMLRAVQTAKDTETEDMSLNDWYAKVLAQYNSQLLRVTDLLVGDSAFSKKPFVDKVLDAGFRLVSRLRGDAVLHYKWDGPKTGKRGRPRVIGDRIDLDNLDMTKVKKLITPTGKGEAYSLQAYCKSLKRVVSLVVVTTPEGGRRLLFSTDADMDGQDVLDTYHSRFQIEFCYRDGHQFTGLMDCQSRDERKLDFAYNASFAAQNVAKVIRKEVDPSLSIGKLKSMMVNAHYLQRIIDVFERDSNMTLNNNLVKELFGLVADAS